MGGGGKGAKSAEVPDYASLAAQQGQINQQTANQLTAANRPDQNNGLGSSIQWTQTQSPEAKQAQAILDQYKAGAAQHPEWDPDQIQQQINKYQADVDSAGGAGTWQQNVNYSPDYIARYNAQQQANDSAVARYTDSLKSTPNSYTPTTVNQTTNSANAIASPYTGVPQFTDKMGTFDKSQGDAVADALYKSVMDRALPQQGKDTDAMTGKLRLQGLQQGTQAYDDAIKNLQTSQADSNNLAAQNAVLGGYNAASQIYNTNLGGFNANLGAYNANVNNSLGSYNANLAANQQNLAQQQQDFNQQQGIAQTNANQYQTQLSGLLGNASLAQTTPAPTFQGFSGATGYNPTDLVGAAQATQAGNQSSANASNSKKSGLLGAGASLGGSYLGSK